MTPAQAALLSVLAAPAGEPLGPLPATMLAAAHPGDETAGAGSRLPRLASARFVCVTDGAPGNGEDASRHGFTPEEYARARRLELQTVLVRCGIAPSRLAYLDAPDQQAPQMLARLARQLAGRMVDEGTQVVLTQPYEGGHPDHDATAFVVHAAAALLRARRDRAPDIVEMASWHRGPDGARTCGFLARADAGGEKVLTVTLTPQEQHLKSDLIASFATQQQALRSFPLDCEAFRPAPRYDFLAPPHPGPLHYEHYAWGMRGERFRALAADALAELGLQGRT